MDVDVYYLYKPTKSGLWRLVQTTNLVVADIYLELQYRFTSAADYAAKRWENQHLRSEEARNGSNPCVPA